MYYCRMASWMVIYSSAIFLLLPQIRTTVSLRVHITVCVVKILVQFALGSSTVFEQLEFCL